MHRIFHDTNGDALYYQVIIPYSMKVPFLELCHADAAGHLKLITALGTYNGVRGGSPGAAICRSTLPVARSAVHISAAGCQNMLLSKLRLLVDHQSVGQ
jgi:hypothetical protein